MSSYGGVVWYTWVSDKPAETRFWWESGFTLIGFFSIFINLFIRDEHGTRRDFRPPRSDVTNMTRWILPAETKPAWVIVLGVLSDTPGLTQNPKFPPSLPLSSAFSWSQQTSCVKRKTTKICKLDWWISILDGLYYYSAYVSAVSSPLVICKSG